jgi:TPR repeat protein
MMDSVSSCSNLPLHSDAPSLKIIMKKLFLAISFSILFPVLCSAGPADAAREAVRSGDYKKSLELLLPLAEAGDVDALGNVGNMYAFGQGVEKDIDKAYSYWLRASEKHLGTAMGNIAVLYVTGQGSITKDISKAAQWYKRAAEHRHAPSMLTLSSIYMNGEGLERDKPRGLAWASLAATNSRIPQVTEAAAAQTRRIMSASSPDEIAQAKAISNELIKVIDSNLALYRNQ